MASIPGFRALPLPISQLSLPAVLKCGQSFRWTTFSLMSESLASPEDVCLGQLKQIPPPTVEYRFVLRDRVICLRQSEQILYYRAIFPPANGPTLNTSPATGADVDLDSPHDTEALAWLRDYFQLDVDLNHLYDTWSIRDHVFSKFKDRFQGLRILRQDPWECLIAFICSQNNHISRITKMVQALCANFSSPLLSLPPPDNEFGSSPAASPQNYHPFPRPAALASPGTSLILRNLGFGYRAEYIQKTAEMLVREHGEEGAELFLQELRKKKAEEARSELLKFVGVGRKVADCVLLMSMDKPDIIPVDTHVHKIAIKQYGFQSRGRTAMNPKLYDEIQTKLAMVWGEYAGWAHTVLFTADLRSFSTYGLPTLSPSVSPEKQTDESALNVESPSPTSTSFKRKRGRKLTVRKGENSDTTILGNNDDMGRAEELVEYGTSESSLAERVKRRRNNKETKLEPVRIEVVPA